MDSNGLIVDQAHVLDVGDKEVLTWYKNMLTGISLSEADVSRTRGRAKKMIPGLQSA